jgi:hypothetical protein
MQVCDVAFGDLSRTLKEHGKRLSEQSVIETFLSSRMDLTSPSLCFLPSQAVLYLLVRYLTVGAKMKIFRTTLQFRTEEIVPKCKF